VGGDAARRAGRWFEGEPPQTLEEIFGGVSLIPLLALGLSPAVGAGASVDVRYYPLARLSLSLEGRALMSQTIDGAAAVRTITVRPQISACGHGGFFSLCALAGYGRLEVLEDPTIKKSEVQEPWSATLGIRPGVEWRFSEHLALRGFLELHAVVGQASVWIDGERIWSAPPVAGILGIGMMLPFDHRRNDGKVLAGSGGSWRF
jgi:hypothetical protein